MPKLKPTPEEAYLNQIRANIAYFTKLRETTPQQLSRAMRCSVSTVYNKMNNPRTITSLDLLRLSSAFRVPPAELLSRLDGDGRRS